MNRFASICIALSFIGVSAQPLCAEPTQPVTLVLDGKPQLPIIAGSIQGPVEELQHYLERATGATLKSEKATLGKRGIHVGLASDFPDLEFKDVKSLGAEGFILRSDGNSIYLIANHPRGVQHAVTTLLHRLGCRWFFPGDTWEIIPQSKTIRGQWDERHTPAFPTQRRIWYGFGAYASGKQDLIKWERHNRMGGPIAISIGHTWHGLRADKEFATHPEWFALVDGKRQPSKPCYSHPEVLKRATESALKQAERGQSMISMTPPDGLGYCECDECKKVFGGSKPFESHKSLFAKRPDGELVNITSETLFRFINHVAEAVAKQHPKTLIGCYAYSAYSHPPSFPLHPNVYLQTTTAYRRTPITLEEQIGAFGKKTTQVGIREYYSVYQWDWDYPNPGNITPVQLSKTLKFFHENGVTAINAEASNNWGARGLSYYVASQLMWDVNTDVNAIIIDFYQHAFGPATPAMQRYYARWYGPEVAVPPGTKDTPLQAMLYKKGKFNVDALKTAFVDLTNAAEAVPVNSDYRKRIDQLRMYAHYLLLRHRLHLAEQGDDDDRILAAIEAETEFGGRLTNTHMIHTRPLLGKAFLRRFRKHETLLAKVDGATQSNKGWRAVGTPPTQKELEILWKNDLAELGIR